LKELKQISVIGLGLLGGSITLAVSRSFPGVKTVGYSHRPSTRRKAVKLSVAHQVVDNTPEAVAQADIVILATPIYIFEEIFSQIAEYLPTGCIVTDVGSTKVLPHRWAEKCLPKKVHYVGSHPVAGSEQRGVEFARDDLFDKALCVLTATKKTDRPSVEVLKNFWMRLGSVVRIQKPAEHDRIFANISHLVHLTAVALVNANRQKDLHFAGKGFIDTSRVASGPVNIWSDIMLANSKNVSASIDGIIAELMKLKKTITKNDRKQLEKLLETARNKRNTMIQEKMEKGELL
jgi:prephenate dehydrogenase